MSLDPQLVTATRQLLQRARSAAHQLVSASTADKDAFLAVVSRLLVDRADTIAAANARDTDRARDKGRTEAFVDRLQLRHAGLTKLAATVDEIRALPDPVGRTTFGAKRKLPGTHACACAGQGPWQACVRGLRETADLAAHARSPWDELRVWDPGD